MDNLGAHAPRERFVLSSELAQQIRCRPRERENPRPQADLCDMSVRPSLRSPIPREMGPGSRSHRSLARDDSGGCRPRLIS